MLEPALVQSRWETAEVAYRGKIRAYSHCHWAKIPGFGQDDLANELLEVLWLCVQGYDPDNGATFNTYFWQAVHNRFADLVKHAFRKKRGADVHQVSLDVDAVRQAIEERTSTDGGEEFMMAVSSVQERFCSLTPRRQRRILQDLS